MPLKGLLLPWGFSSWEGFRARCGPDADSLSHAEHKLLQDAGGRLQPVDWVGLLAGPRGKLQSSWSAKLREHQRDTLLTSLPEDDQVDLRTCNSPGVGGFVEALVQYEDE